MFEDVRSEKSLRKLLASAGAVETPPVEQLRRRNITIVTDTEIRADPGTGDPVKTVVRRGLRVVAKIDWLFARKMIDQPQYEAALMVLSWLRQARLGAPSAMLLLLESPMRKIGKAREAGWNAERLDALARLRRLRNDIGAPMMELLLYVLLDDGDLSEWSGLTARSGKRRKDRGAVTVSMLHIALDRVHRKY